MIGVSIVSSSTISPSLSKFSIPSPRPFYIGKDWYKWRNNFEKHDRSSACSNPFWHLRLDEVSWFHIQIFYFVWRGCNFLKLFKVVWHYNFIYIQIFFDFNYINSYYSLIPDKVTIDTWSGSLKSDDLLVYKFLNFMFQVDTFLSNIPNTSWTLSTVKIRSINLGVDIDIFRSIVCIMPDDSTLSKSHVRISSKGVNTLEGFFSWFGRGR